MEQMDLDRETPDLNGGVAAANGAEPADSHESAGEHKGPLTLEERLVAVRKGCDAIQKESAGMGTGHAIDAVLSAVRPLLNQHGILIIPHLEDVSYDGNRCNVLVRFEWMCTDDRDADTWSILWGGSDTDKAGKGLAKAMTNALKEHLKKMLLITDRTDAAEETDQVEHQTDEGLNRQAVQKAEEDVKAMFHAWATNFTQAIKASSSSTALKALKRENASQLSNPALPEVTRKHLEGLYADRLATLKEFEAEQNAEALE